MPRINLLPHREQERKRKRREFAIAAGVAGGGRLSSWVGGKLVYTSWTDAQIEKNNLLKKEIVKLDAQIADIQDLESRKQRLVARMEDHRAAAAHVGADRPSVRRVREDRSRRRVSHADQGERPEDRDHGYRPHRAPVSTFMRNIDASMWMDNPQLQVVRGSPNSPQPAVRAYADRRQNGVNLERGW